MNPVSTPRPCGHPNDGCCGTACIAHRPTGVLQASDVGIAWLKYDQQAQPQPALVMLMSQAEESTLDDVLTTVSRYCCWSAGLILHNC